MKPFHSFLVCMTAASASCAVYDKELLEKGQSASTDGGDGDGDAGPSGGAPNTGGGSGTTGAGGSSSGGMGGDGAGTGGAENCVDPTEDFTVVTEWDVLDSFDTDWRPFTNATTAWNGQWNTSPDPGIAEDMTPFAGPGTVWEKGGYQELDCTPGGLALHVEALGSTSYGVSFDGALTDVTPAVDVDLSAYAGVVFWAKSSNGTQIKLSFADASDVIAGVDAPVPPLKPEWEQRRIPFPNGYDSSKVAVVKIVGFNAPVDETKPIDFWIENLSFYKN